MAASQHPYSFCFFLINSVSHTGYTWPQLSKSNWQTCIQCLVMPSHCSWHQSITPTREAIYTCVCAHTCSFNHFPILDCKPTQMDSKTSLNCTFLLPRLSVCLGPEWMSFWTAAAHCSMDNPYSARGYNCSVLYTKMAGVMTPETSYSIENYCGTRGDCCLQYTVFTCWC